MIAKFLLVTALDGKLRRFSCCNVCGPPKSSGQVSKATQGVIAMRAPSGHLIGDLFGLIFILPPRSKKFFRSVMPQFPPLSNRPVALVRGHINVEQFFIK